MKRYEFNVSVWYDSKVKEWFYSVIQEFDGQPETLLYGSHDSQRGAFESISDCIGELEF